MEGEGERYLFSSKRNQLQSRVVPVVHTQRITTRLPSSRFARVVHANEIHLAVGGRHQLRVLGLELGGAVERRDAGQGGSGGGGEGIKTRGEVGNEGASAAVAGRHIMHGDIGGGRHGGRGRRRGRGGRRRRGGHGGGASEREREKPGEAERGARRRRGQEGGFKRGPRGAPSEQAKGLSTSKAATTRRPAPPRHYAPSRMGLSPPHLGRGIFAASLHHTIRRGEHGSGGNAGASGKCSVESGNFSVSPPTLPFCVPA